METVNLPAVFAVFKTFGIVGLIIVLWYFDHRIIRKIVDQHKRDMQKVLDRYKDDMVAMRHMYESNVSLVKDYHSIAADLKDIVILNIQKLTKVSDEIRQNEFCPRQRVRKKRAIVKS